MMIDKRLIGTVPESKKYIAANVALQWCGLIANVAMMISVASLLASLLTAPAATARLLTTAAVAAAAVLIRCLCTTGAARMSDLSSRAVKKTLRTQIYEKLLRLGASYSEQVSTAEVVQVAVEGVDQLETYFGAYLPQFFYAMLAPLTLFAVLCFVNVPAAFALLVCVPLIPVAIAAVQTWAKKLLSRYWGQYTKLGDTFLENLQGLTTLKIYQADGLRNDVMNEEAEKFRKITMKVLTMQLNSVTIMDVIAYGGAALGVILAATQYRAGHVALSGALLIILLERTSMIGVLKALGMGNRSLQKMFVIRSSFIILKGMFWGNLFGVGLCLLQHCTGLVRLDQAGYFLTTVPIFIDWGWWALLNLITFAFIVSLLALPTMIISLILPEKSIRFE